jgi:Protein of unknown function (DUF3644)
MPTTKKRNRRLFSIKEELLRKSREAALAAVQVFNNPNISFKSETYIVLMIIAWTYLLHAYYRKQKVDYRYFTKEGQRKQFDYTKNNAVKHWELERCLNDANCPLDIKVVQNLKFLIGLRHEIEHQMTTRIDDLLSARFQACCINFHDAIAGLFGEVHGIAKFLAVSLQFSSLNQEQVDTLDQHVGLPSNIKKYIEGFDGALPSDVFASAKFAYRVIFVPKTANHPNQADQVITFVKEGSELAKKVNASYTVIRETEKQKWLPSQIVAKVKADGFPKFTMTHHTDLWKALDAKSNAMCFGVQIAKTWYWYDSWVGEVQKHCAQSGNLYR